MNIRDGFIRNLWNYLTKVRPARSKIKEEVVGTDLIGNKYVIKRGDPMSRRKEVRSMIAPDKNVENYAENLGLEVPQEWDAWLRYRRKDPPTLEELQRNILEKEKIQERVREIKLREERENIGVNGVSDETAVAKDISVMPEKASFPVYDDIERIPGEFQRKKPPKN